MDFMVPKVLRKRLNHHKRLSISVAAFVGTSILIIPVFLASAASLLINIDVGLDGRTNVGFAAIGQSTNDFWNGIQTPFQAFGVLSNVLAADGTVTAVGFTISNTAGLWGTGSSNSMYDSYDYNNQSGTGSAALLNVPSGTYDLLLYGYEGNYGVQIGATDYGIKSCADYPVQNPPVWQEGRQYVRFQNLVVAAGQSISIAILRGSVGGYAVIAGLQLLQTASCPHTAAATVQVVNGFVVGATITDPGCGYLTPPRVAIQGGGGTGATATAVVNNGNITQIVITDAGTGYTNTPLIFIDPPPGIKPAAALIKAVRPSFADLTFGMTYQLQVSPDLNTWTNAGPPFTATNTSMVYPQYWDAANWNQLFFQLQLVR
jgi:hypothetical protein